MSGLKSTDRYAYNYSPELPCICHDPQNLHCWLNPIKTRTIHHTIRNRRKPEDQKTRQTRQTRRPEDQTDQTDQTDQKTRQTRQTRQTRRPEDQTDQKTRRPDRPEDQKTRRPDRPEDQKTRQTRRPEDQKRDDLSLKIKPLYFEYFISSRLYCEDYGTCKKAERHFRPHA